jgi:hypothetical protein
MQNPFEDVKIKPEVDLIESGDEYQQKMAKRDEIYSKFDPMVNEVLELFIAAHRKGIWEKDSDCARRYCCHLAWFAGPKEKYSDPYDKHHLIRRRIEITLEMDSLCNPTGFMVTNFEAIDRTIHVGLEREDLVRGIKVVME